MPRSLKIVFMSRFITAASMFEFAFLHTQSYGESYFSFVNGQYTADGGTHLSAFREGILKGVNEYAKKNFQGVDVREGIVGTILVKVKDPVFESQTKNKLGNTELRAPSYKRSKTQSSISCIKIQLRPISSLSVLSLTRS